MIISLISDATQTGAGTTSRPKEDGAENRTFQAVGSTSSGTGAATVTVEGSNDGRNWILIGTISLTLGTAETTDGFASNAAWEFVRGNVTSISGTGAKVSLIAGV